MLKFKNSYDEGKELFDKAHQHEPQFYLESGRARMLQMLNGVVPRVHTFGIITAENPLGKELPTKENQERNKKLEQRLKDGNFGYRQIIGKYGNIENPFLINNIHQDALRKLAVEYEQESYIHAVKQFTKDGNPYIKFTYYIQNFDEDVNRNRKGRGNFHIVSERFVYRDATNKEDYYSEYMGKKFIIPFFDDDDESKAKMIGGKIIFEESDLDTSEKRMLAEEINDQCHMLCFNDHDNGMGTWGRRGIVKVQLAKLRQLIEG